MPVGKDEENAEMYKKGDIPTMPEGAKPHWDLIEQYDIIDFELGNKVSGAGFPFIKVKYATCFDLFLLDEAVSAGYLEVQLPIVINEASGYVLVSYQTKKVKCTICG